MEQGVIDLHNASIEEIKLLPGIGEKSANKIVQIRETGAQLSLSLFGTIAGFPLSILRKHIETGLIEPLQGDATHDETSGLGWYRILKEERAEAEKFRAERDFLHRKMEMEELTKQKDREFEDRLLKQEQIFQTRLEESLANHIGSRKDMFEIKKGEEVDGDGSLDETDFDSERLHLEQQKIAKLVVDLPSDGVYRGKAFTNRVFTSTPKTDCVDQNMGGPSASGDTLNKGKPQSNSGNSRSRSRPSTPNHIQKSASRDKSGHRSKKYSSSSSSCSTDVSDIPSDTESSSSASACNPRYEKQAHGKSHKAYRRRRHSPPAPKLPTFNGGTGTWRPFIFQFKEVATMNKCSKSTRREMLMGCLSGKALSPGNNVGLQPGEES